MRALNNPLLQGPYPFYDQADKGIGKVGDWFRYGGLFVS